MARLCIPAHQIEKLKNSALAGEFDVKKLYEMSDAERVKFFTKHTDEALGRLLNKEFEKAMVSKSKTAFRDLFESVLKPKMKDKSFSNNILKKIDQLDELGVLSPNDEKKYLRGLVEDSLGVGISPQEVANIKTRAQKIQAAQKKLGDDLGNPSKVKENMDFLVAKREMDDYLQSITPASKLKILTGTIGRGSMLASVKSPILNIGSNIEVGFTEAVARRLSQFSLGGGQGKLMKDYVKMVNKIYTKTGYDISRMMNIADTGASGSRILGEDLVHSQGKGKFRAVGRFYEDVVFKNLMGAPDTVFASGHFADSVSINAKRMTGASRFKKMSQKESELAQKYMIDAMRIEPRTAKGRLLRDQAIMDAQKATWTNKTWASKLSEGVRNIFNDVSGDARVGDYLFPFVKTPSNVIATGMDYAGMGIPKALLKSVKAIRSGGYKEIATKEFRDDVIPDLIRSGIGLAASAAFVWNIPKENFVGAYDPNRHQIEGLRNSNYNAVRIGNKWVSVDWFGPLSVPVTSMLYAKKYGGSKPEKAFQYSKAVIENVYRLPGVEDVYDFFKKRAYNKKGTGGEAAESLVEYSVGEAASRLIPGLSNDFAKAVDPVYRETEEGWIGALQKVGMKIPFVSKTLPEKKDVFGDTVVGEPAYSDILFGSRVKTARESDVLKEVSRVVQETDQSINFTEWGKGRSKAVEEYKSSVSEEEFEKAKKLYGEELKRSLEATINTEAYKKLDDSQKQDILTDIDSKVRDMILYKNDGGSLEDAMSGYRAKSVYNILDKSVYENDQQKAELVIQQLAKSGKSKNDIENLLELYYDRKTDEERAKGNRRYKPGRESKREREDRLDDLLDKYYR